MRIKMNGARKNENRQLTKKSIPTRKTFDRTECDFKIEGPFLPLLFDEYTEEAQLEVPGCIYIDLSFEKPTQIREMSFRNFYVAMISVYVRLTLRNNKKWIAAVPFKKLMPYPHFEEGSQDLFTILEKDVTKNAWNKINTVRLVLRQPSPVWKTFYLDELKFFNDLPSKFTREVSYPNKSRAPGYEKMDVLMALVRLQTDTAMLSLEEKKARNIKETTLYEISKLPVT